MPGDVPGVIVVRLSWLVAQVAATTVRVMVWLEVALLPSSLVIAAFIVIVKMPALALEFVWNVSSLVAELKETNELASGVDVHE